MERTKRQRRTDSYRQMENGRQTVTDRQRQADRHADRENDGQKPRVFSNMKETPLPMSDENVLGGGQLPQGLHSVALRKRHRDRE